MVSLLDEKLMHSALNEAWKYQGLTFPNPAVGAVLSDENGNIIAVGAHQKAGKPHAEVIALKNGYYHLTQDERILSIEDSSALHDFLQHNHNNLFHELTLHVSLEPCHHFGKTPPCSKLIDALGIQKIVIGARDKSAKAKGGGEYLRAQGKEVLFFCLKAECERLLTPFTCKEKHQPFVFFKIALSANNVATGGIISSEASRTMVHALRDVCDLLVIGGNTVRTDRPVLDARLCEGKAPDVLIYSRSINFDKSIPLFSIAKREVFIKDSLDTLNNYSMVMIEGAETMLRACQNHVTWYLVFRSPHDREGRPVCLPEGLKEIYSRSIGEDTMTWYCPSC